MITELALFGSTFVVVFALGAQSLLVNNGYYMAAFLNSLVIGTCNLLLFKLTPNATLPQMAAFLMGGPFGILAAMYAFRHLHRKREKVIPVQEPAINRTANRRRCWFFFGESRWWKQ